MKNNTKAKRAYLSKLKKIVASHTYDLGKKVLDEGVENAKEKHDVDLGIHKSMKDVIKEVVQVNTKVKNYIKATKDEVSEVVKEGTKQAIVAIKNEKGEMTTEEDEFLSSFDVDLDDLDSDDWKDILSEADDDDDSGDEDDDEEPGMESAFIKNMWEAAKEYTEQSNKFIISKLTNDDISAAILLLLQKVPCPHFQELYSTHVEEMEEIVRSTACGFVEEVQEGSGDKLNYVKNMIQEVNSDMVPNVGTEDDDETVPEELETVGIVVEVIPTELPTAVPPTKDELTIEARLHRVIHMFFNKVESFLEQDEESRSILGMADAKIDAVCAYVSAISSRNQLEICNLITKSIETVAPECLPVGRRVAMAFYLGIIPEDLIAQGRRIVSIYYNKIIKE